MFSIAPQQILVRYIKANSENLGWFTLFFKTSSSMRIQPLMGTLWKVLHGCTWRFVHLASSQKLPAHLKT